MEKDRKALKNADNHLRAIYGMAFIILTAVEIFIALFVHDNIIRPYVGDILVVFVVFCFVRILIPNQVKFLSLYVFLFASGVEILQFFDLVHLLGLSGNWLARILIGSIFDIKDIVCYAAGCLILAFGEWMIRKNQVEKH